MYWNAHAFSEETAVFRGFRRNYKQNTQKCKPPAILYAMNAQVHHKRDLDSPVDLSAEYGGQHRHRRPQQHGATPYGVNAKHNVAIEVEHRLECSVHEAQNALESRPSHVGKESRAHGLLVVVGPAGGRVTHDVVAFILT